MKTSNSLSVSRRQFLFGSVAIGALTLLGTCATKNGLIAAFADEEGNASFELVIIGRGDIAIMAIDPSTNTVLADMDVTITSYAEEAKEKTLNVKTNDKGIAVVNARYLGENCDEDSPDDGYGFWASVEATKPGYRDYATSVVRIQTGPGLQTESGGRQANLTIPSQTYNSATDFGYVRRLSFNGFDVQYFASSFCACNGNTAEHTLSIELVGEPGASVGAQFVYDGNELASANSKIGSDGKALMEMKGKWLCDIEADKTAQVFFTIDDAEFEAPCQLSFFGAADGIDQYSQREGSMQVGESTNPFLEDEKSVSAYKVKLPETFPIWGGTYVDLPLPELPIVFQFDPTGSVQLGVTANLLPFIPKLKEQSWVGNTNWDKIRTETWSQMRDRQIESECQAVQRYTDAKWIKQGGSKEGTQTKFGGKVNLTFSASLAAKADWTWGSNVWKGGGNLCLIIGGAYELGNVALVGPVPIYYGFDVAASCTTTFYAGFQTESGFKNFGWNPDTLGLTIVFRAEVGVQGGIGIKGFMSFGARGYGYLQFTIGLIKTEKAFPHYVLEGNMLLTLVINALFSSFTVSVWHFKDEKDDLTIYDNWSSSLAADEAVQAQIPDAFKNSRATYIMTDGQTLDLSKFVPALISQKDLLAIAEFSATAKETTGEEDARDLEMEVSFSQSGKTSPKISGFGIVPSSNLLATANSKPKLGIVPAVDECIYENISCDARQKVVKTSNGETYMFRLAIVNVNSISAGSDGYHFKFNSDTGLFEKSDKALSKEEVSQDFSVPRSRIVMSKMTSAGTWSDPELVDFYIKNESQKQFRLNCNDYDFAVCEKPDEAGVFFLNVVSSQVLENSEDSFEDRWKSQFVTMFKYDSNKTGNERLVVGKVLMPETGISRYCPAVNYRKADSRVFFSFVQANIDGDVATYSLNTNVYEESALSWAYAIASNARPAFGGQNTTLYQSFKVAKGPMWEDTSADMTGITWVGPSLNSEGYQVFFQAYSLNSKDMLPGTDYTYTNVAEPILVPEKGWIVVDLDEGETDKPDRRELTFNSMNKKNSMIVQQKVGIANMTAFSPSSDGARLFAVHTTDGSDSTSDCYQIYAADWDSANDSYHSFYPFCQTTHPLDQVEAVVCGSGNVSFITTEITDSEAGKGNIHQMNVPLVASVQLESATCMDVFAGVGDTCHAYVCAQNNGNLPLSGFTVKLYDNEEGTGEPLATKKFDNFAEQMMANVYDYQGDDEEGNAIHVPDEVWLAQKNANGDVAYGNFTAEDFYSLFWPGDERTFASVDFTIPDSWEDKGTVQVYAFVSDPVADETRVADIRKQSAPSFEGEAQAQSSLAADFDVAGSVTPDSLGVFYDADLASESFEVSLTTTLAKDEKLKAATYEPKNEAAKEASSGKIPETGDKAQHLSGPVAILGAGAAAVAAYSKRRCENEVMANRLSAKHAKR